MKWYRNLRMVTKIVFPVAVTLIIILGILAWRIQATSSEIVTSIAQRELAAMAGEQGNAVKGLFEIALDSAKALGDSLQQQLRDQAPMPRDQLIRQLLGLETSNDAILAAGAAFEPNAYDGKDAENANAPGCDKNGRFIPYSSGGKITPLEDLETSAYYAQPKKLTKSFLTKPYFYDVNGKKTLMSTASAVITTQGAFRGILLVDLSLERIVGIVRNVKVYKSGWGAVVSQDGTIVADKDISLVGKNIFDIDRVSRPAELKKAMTDGASFLERHATKSGESFVYYYPIKFEITGQTWYFTVSAPMNEVLEAVGRLQTLTLGISLAVLMLSVLVIWLVVRASVKPLNTLAGAAKGIAGGNLHTPINDETFGGEIRELSTALKGMIASLLENINKSELLSQDARNQTVKAEEAMREAEVARQNAERAKRDGMLTAAQQLEGVVHIISSASHELATQVEQSEHRSCEQASRIGETAAAMEEMNSTVLEVARNAAAASDGAAHARAKAEEGAHIVQAAVTGINKVQEVSLALKSDMNTLAEQAQSISQIMSVISDIADQTNLLALNAAIEAARAGEAGRGFAVVADEVRKLAEKTMVSTIDVGRAIQSIQQSVNQSMSQVERAVGLIDVATDQSNKSGISLNEIVGMVDGTADQVRAIATASEEQSSTSEEINRAIAQVSSMAEQTADAMRKSAKAVSEMSRQASALSGLIDEMKKG